MSSISTTNFSGAIATHYIPALNNVNAPFGLKALMLAHTVVEGFNPNSVAFKTNNPGNIGTDTVQGNIKRFPTLTDGIAAQLRQKMLILQGQSRYYKPTDTLLKYLTTYAPPSSRGNNPAAYAAIVISVFKKLGYTITQQTTLQQIAALPDLKKKSNNSSSNSNNSIFRGIRFFITGQ